MEWNNQPWTCFTAMHRRFFALPLEKKNSTSINKSPSFNGYIESGSEKSNNVVDTREGMYLGRKYSHDKVMIDNFPDESDLPGFAETVRTYRAQLIKLGFAMMKAVAVGLGLPDNYFEDKCSPPINLMSFWHYPLHPAETDSWGVGPHTDYGMWTFLLQDDVGGLEAEITEGKWNRLEANTRHILWLTWETASRLGPKVCIEPQDIV
ncbi:hypothetical protein OS493_033753 [Desmophyllum pertusum]|uniref:Uncharacterized protein n=1 Tax=Desmophyllum pertusum TaxID=174260 RepID=A0A9W9Z7K3_9CNID|nr:hypothetical protein OS493_033753 [Desmophyllum pertusum]